MEVVNEISVAADQILSPAWVVVSFPAPHRGMLDVTLVCLVQNP